MKASERKEMIKIIVSEVTKSCEAVFGATEDATPKAPPTKKVKPTSLAAVLKQRKLVPGNFNAYASVVNCAAQGVSAKNKLTIQQQLDFFELHHDAVTFGVTNFTSKVYKPVMLAPVMSVVARAWYHVNDKEKLKRFASVLKTGSEHKGEEIITSLHGWLEHCVGRGKGVMSDEIYLKTQAVLQDYVNNGHNGNSNNGGVAKLEIPKSDLFPLPKLKQTTTTVPHGNVSSNAQ